MKPVEKGSAPRVYTAYDQAKLDLLDKIGLQCSYCEVGKDPQDLHVEHIYPKAPHPEKELDWKNFLVSCNTCNSYKNIYLGNSRRRGLEKKYIWPHLENSFRAFQYFADGRVELRPRLIKEIKAAALKTHEMVGLMLSPAKAASYKKKGIAYDGVSKRSQQWAQALSFRVTMYLPNPTQQAAVAIANNAAGMGYFSIWMEVFHDRPEVRRELIRAFKADPSCFDVDTKPVRKNRL
jgi:uncharacterized protein (TIGR02646 family)